QGGPEAERNAGVVEQPEVDQPQINHLPVGEQGLGRRLDHQVGGGQGGGPGEQHGPEPPDRARTRPGPRSRFGAHALGSSAGADCVLFGAVLRLIRPARTPLAITTISASSWMSTTAASPSTPKRASGISTAISSRDRPTFCS